ncbi:unnamed protein product [Spirodela intermedia]|uniref:Uncharacterized protein n=1 Tax=Spirodela intermedia TaxID=51605 RepID=A0A7I8KQP1_SPIIN|nr:unnamed protein product [Spirodela intermedia]
MRDNNFDLYSTHAPKIFLM